MPNIRYWLTGVCKYCPVSDIWSIYARTRYEWAHFSAPAQFRLFSGRSLLFWIPPIPHHMPPATLQSRPAVAEGRNFFYQGVLFSFFSTRIKLFIHNGRSSAAAVSINNKITTRGLNLVFGPAAAHFFDKSATFLAKVVLLDFFGTRHHRSLLLSFFGCRELFPPFPNGPLHIFTGFFLDNNLVPRSSCLLPLTKWLVGFVVQVHRFDNDLVASPWSSLC